MVKFYLSRWRMPQSTLPFPPSNYECGKFTQKYTHKEGRGKERERAREIIQKSEQPFTLTKKVRIRRAGSEMAKSNCINFNDIRITWRENLTAEGVGRRQEFLHTC
jgi:hypothetical protein